jgi:hypothetical protein
VFEATRLYKGAEAAEVLGLSMNAFTGWAWRAQVPRVEFSKRSIRYKGSDLDKAIERAKAIA